MKQVFRMLALAAALAMVAAACSGGHHAGRAAAANAFVDFMLSQPAQRLEARNALEIPVVKGVRQAKGMPAADQLMVPGLDVRQFEILSDARRLLTQLGITG
jgi:ABC-type Fe3+ transport system substrate-binding protein